MELLSLSRMARRLRVTVAWLREEAEASRVPCLRAGRRYLFCASAVERVLAERAATQTTKATQNPQQ
jgi:hypothetical protein